MFKSHLLRLILVSSSLFALNACRVDTPDGKIPEDYIAQAKQMVGNYRGQMQGGQAGALTFRLDGTRVIVKMTGGRLLGADCSSDIGSLRSVEVSGNTVSEAIFDLNGADCIQGSSIALRVSSDLRSIHASVLRESHTEESCPSQYEINSCQRGVDDRERKCDDLDSPMEVRQCHSEASRDYSNCADCTTTTVGSYIEGLFQR